MAETSRCVLEEMCEAKRQLRSIMEPLGPDQLRDGGIGCGVYACRACGGEVQLVCDFTTLGFAVTAESPTLRCRTEVPSASEMLVELNTPDEEW